MELPKDRKYEKLVLKNELSEIASQMSLPQHAQTQSLSKICWKKKAYYLNDSAIIMKLKYPRIISNSKFNIKTHSEKWRIIRIIMLDHKVLEFHFIKNGNTLIIQDINPYLHCLQINMELSIITGSISD